MKKTICIILAAMSLVLCCSCAASDPGTTGGANLQAPGLTTQSKLTTAAPEATTAPVWPPVTTLPAATTQPTMPESTAAPTEPAVTTAPATQPTVPEATEPPATQSPYPREVSCAMVAERHGYGDPQDYDGYQLFVVRSMEELEEVRNNWDPFDCYDITFFNSNTLLYLKCEEPSTGYSYCVTGMEKTDSGKFVLYVEKRIEQYGSHVFCNGAILVEVYEMISKYAQVEVVFTETIIPHEPKV